MSALYRFLIAPARKRHLAMEAAWELTRARIVTMRSASVYTSALGKLVEDVAATPGDGDAETLGAEIGAMVSQISRILPFRAKCLQQAIAVRRMLVRREIPATVFLGIARDQIERSIADHAAHAWVSVGARVVSGEDALDRFAVVARFG